MFNICVPATGKPKSGSKCFKWDQALQDISNFKNVIKGKNRVDSWHMVEPVDGVDSQVSGLFQLLWDQPTRAREFLRTWILRVRGSFWLYEYQKKARNKKPTSEPQERGFNVRGGRHMGRPSASSRRDDLRVVRGEGGSGPDGAGSSKSERLAPSSVLKVAQGFFDFCHLFGRQHIHITDQFVVIKVGKTLNFAAGADSLTHRAQIVCGRT